MPWCARECVQGCHWEEVRYSLWEEVWNRVWPKNHWEVSKNSIKSIFNIFPPAVTRESTRKSVTLCPRRNVARWQSTSARPSTRRWWRPGAPPRRRPSASLAPRTSASRSPPPSAATRSATDPNRSARPTWRRSASRSPRLLSRRSMSSSQSRNAGTLLSRSAKLKSKNSF